MNMKRLALVALAALILTGCAFAEQDPTALAASYDLGENLRVILLAVTEGEDKPLKYPTIFNSADIAITTNPIWRAR